MRPHHERSSSSRVSVPLQSCVQTFPCTWALRSCAHRTSRVVQYRRRRRFSRRSSRDPCPVTISRDVSQSIFPSGTANHGPWRQLSQRDLQSSCREGFCSFSRSLPLFIPCAEHPCTYEVISLIAPWRGVPIAPFRFASVFIPLWDLLFLSIILKLFILDAQKFQPLGHSLNCYPV